MNGLLALFFLLDLIPWPTSSSFSFFVHLLWISPLAHYYTMRWKRWVPANRSHWRAFHRGISLKMPCRTRATLYFCYDCLPLKTVFPVFLPLCRALLPRWSARCQHPKCLQFERETAAIVLFSHLHEDLCVCFSPIHRCPLFCRLCPGAAAAGVWGSGWDWCCWKMEPFTHYVDFQDILSSHS